MSGMQYQTILLTVDRGIARLTLNRPEVKNAFHPLMLAELWQACSDLAAMADLRGLILTGSGDHFCAGADLGWMKGSVQLTREENVRDAQAMFDTFYALAFLPCLTAAVANGPSYGGGLGLLAACDLTIAAEEASFAFTEVRLGIAPAVISPFVLRKARASWTRDVMMTGRRFNASEGLQNGFFQRVVPADKLGQATEELTREIWKTSPNAARKTKELLDRGAGIRPAELREYLAEAIAELRVSPEGQEGLRAFFEKRKPSWHVES
jgi:methylglutaconyl-CoA hydratase